MSASFRQITETEPVLGSSLVKILSFEQVPVRWCGRALSHPLKFSHVQDGASPARLPFVD
jgi:hypothetical protein